MISGSGKDEKGKQCVPSYILYMDRNKMTCNLNDLEINDVDRNMRNTIILNNLHGKNTLHDTISALSVIRHTILDTISI